PVSEPVRFVALGDGGEGNEAQYAVADAVEQICADRGCDFALYLGDNFYDDGVVSVDDQQFQDKFELPYADIGFRFYVVLGNHDYGEVIPEWDKSAYEIEYTDYSEKWYLPAEWYTWKVGEDVEFFALDTHRMMLAEGLQEQRNWLAGALSGSTAKWKIGLAHHPYISNGSHGNAGNYEGLDSTFLAGGNIKDTFDDQVCGAMQVFFSGHDHTRQWLHPTCNTQFFVSGAAAKTTELERRNDNPVDYEDDQKEGFMWVEIDGDQLTGAFYDRDGNLDFEKSITLADITN
ncbi:MAG: metallophosphoesterase, partial [Nannocystaceae bacterium]